MICNNSTFEIITVAKIMPKRRIMPHRPDPVGAIETMQYIISEVAACYDIKIGELTGTVQKRVFVEPRQLAMFLIKEFIPLIKLITIAKEFSRNHATVIYSQCTAKDLIDTDRAINFMYNKIKHRLIEVLNKEQNAA